VLLSVFFINPPPHRQELTVTLKVIDPNYTILFVYIQDTSTPFFTVMVKFNRRVVVRASFEFIMIIRTPLDTARQNQN